MTVAKEYVLDWREQYSTLEPYFNGRGGVVHVHVNDISPTGVFVRALRSRWLAEDRWRFRWTSLLIDPDDPYTRELDGIVTEVHAKVLGRRPKQRTRSTVNATIAAGNDVGGDLVVTGNEFVIESDHRLATAQVGERIDDICGALRKQLKKRRFALVVLNSHRYAKSELVLLGRRLWAEGLDSLTAQGLLLVDISDPTSAANGCDAWPPRANVVIRLPAEFGKEEETHAIDDLTAIAIEEGLCGTEAEARMFAKTLYNSGPGAVRDLYGRLGHAMLGLKADK